MEHSNVMGGSTAPRRINCPGSFKREEAAPPQPASDDANLGSMLHACMELMITNTFETLDEVLKTASEFVGQDLGYDVVVTQEHVNDKILPAAIAWWDMLNDLNIVEWHIEKRVNFGDLVPGAFGTSDVIAVDDKNCLHIIDWKFGDGVDVEAKGNMSLGFYAAAALYTVDDDDEFAASMDKITDVQLHIVQPRRNDPDVVKSWHCGLDWVEDLLDLITDAMTLAVTDNPPHKAGAWCRWCQGKVGCPAYTEMADISLAQDPKDLTAVELSAAMKRAELLKPWIKAVHERALEEMERGLNVPAYKLVRGRASRKYRDAGAVEKALRALKIKVSEMYEKTLISPAQLEKKFKSAYAKIAEEHVVTVHSKVSIAPIEDKRPAVDDSMTLLSDALSKGESNMAHHWA